MRRTQESSYCCCCRRRHHHIRRRYFCCRLSHRHHRFKTVAQVESQMMANRIHRSHSLFSSSFSQSPVSSFQRPLFACEIQMLCFRFFFFLCLSAKKGVKRSN